MRTTQREFWLELPDGQRRFARCWWPASGHVEALMCIAPGLGEHSGRYMPLADELTRSGIGVVSMDLHGQGLSPGGRGCVRSYESLLVEVQCLVRLARGSAALGEFATQVPRAKGDVAELDVPTIKLTAWPRSDDQPVSLYGHSMGGNLVINSVLRGLADPERVIASAPMLRAVHPPGPWLTRLIRVLMHVAPNYRLKAPVRTEYLSNLQSEKDAYGRDPLVHRRVSLRLGAGLIDSGIWAMENAARLDRPCLIMHGTSDKITDPVASQQFAAAAIAAGAPCRCQLYPGMLHDLHRDQGKDQVIADIVKWVRSGE